jgi:diguanylate cyclase (GGDEF)-like protein
MATVKLTDMGNALKAKAKAIQDLSGRTWRRLLSMRSHLRFGIVAHLALAFLAVGALAVAANMFAVHGTVFVAPTPLPVEKIVYVPVAASPPESPAAEPASEATVPLDATRLRSAVSDLEQATRSRTHVGGDAAGQRLSAATKAVDTAASDFLNRARVRVGVNRIGQLRDAVDELTAAALKVGELSEGKRHLSGEYRRNFEAMDARVAQSIDRAWKIFGRVIARESIVVLSRQVAQIRRHLAELDQNANPVGDAARLEASEAAFLEILEKKAASLAQSQGETWVARMRADHGLLVAGREALEQTRIDLRTALDRFAAARGALEPAIATMASASARPAVALTRPARTPSASVPGNRSEAVLSLSTAGEAPTPATRAQEIKAQVPAGETERPHQSRILAWISVLVLFVLLIISSLMALRVIRPVRQLQAATRRLQEGKLDARVAGGGIRELHELGVSFNQMAQRLADARVESEDYQKVLETRVSERTRQLQHLAEHDPLTELPNRRQLFTQLSAALREADAGASVLGVMVLDLDNFKNINDTMGHSYGDRVLQGVAKRLDAVVSPCGFSARQGGDEFTIVCPAASCVDDVVEVAQRILTTFQEPLNIDGRELAVSVSIGVAAFPLHASDADALLRAADAALFRAKALGRHRMNVFSPDLLDAAASRFRTEQGLRQAIERGEFELAFQPEVDTATFGVPLVEALLRWRLPDGRLASPGDFLTVAEDSGLIVEISDWVLQSAIAAAARWRYGGWTDVRVAINVSPRQVAAPDFATRLVGLLEGAGLPPGCIEIELTEHVLQTGEATIDTLRALRSRGIGIALDDFGTGYSTLASLEQLPFTRVKLDRSLVARIDTADRSLAIAQTIIELCRRLGLEITAEGVERVEQFAILARASGMHVQGYLLSPPVSADAVRREIANLPARMEALRLAPGITASTRRGKRVASA